MKTGTGQYIDASLVESGLAWSVWEAAGYFGAGIIPKATGSRHRVSARVFKLAIFLKSPIPSLYGQELDSSSLNVFYNGNRVLTI